MNRQAARSITTAFIGAVVLFFFIRLVTPFIIRTLGSGKAILWPERLFLESMRNSGFVFSLPLPASLIVIVTLAVLIAVAWLYVQVIVRDARSELVSFILIFGGAFSNLYERIKFGFVWDYFNIQVFGLRGVWNLADALILAGMLVWLFRGHKHFGEPIETKNYVE